MTEAFDVVVIGSGFGGSVMSYRFAERGLRVCVLERGKAYPAGSFPRSPYEMKHNFWDPSQGLHGMYNVWSFERLSAVVSSGLGGGSLIYANVLIRKDERWFIKEQPGTKGYESWPITRADLEPHYSAVEQIIAPQQFPAGVAPYSTTPKLLAMREAAAELSRKHGDERVQLLLPQLAVTFANPGRPPRPGEPIIEEVPNLHGSPRDTCRMCGECDIGCNFGSKNTLDYNYLSRAKRAGADIRTRSEVRSFRPLSGGGYEVSYVDHTDERRDTHALPLRTIVCRRLVLAAGAIGSTFLLLKNQPHFPGLSPRLGHAVNGNGDILGIAMHARDSHTHEGRIIEPSQGPVITSAIRFADQLDGVGAEGRGFYIEDAGYPQFVNWLAQSADLGGAASRFAGFIWRWLKMHLSANPTSDLGEALSTLLGDGHLTRSALPLLGMGRDVPTGIASLNSGGQLALDWSLEDSRDYFEGVRRAMREISDALGAEYVDDPLWMLSRELTVHPLGGCPMGADSNQGVVNPFGEVFGYPGFYIADGSVLPGPVGPNPSLTIAACANRFADHALS
ncbi:MAG TPA: GMC family oxidoreductase [Polyangiaceae bacterium]|nr:GMC family oxidoreductase [Polyangiaceae bacterium]